VALNEGRDRAREVLSGIVARHRDSQPTARLQILTAHEVLHCRDFFRHAPAVVEELLPEFGQRLAAGGAYQQLLPQQFFEVAQAARDRGLGHAQSFGGAHQACLFGDGGEQDQVVGGDALLFHLWDSLSRIDGFI